MSKISAGCGDALATGFLARGGQMGALMRSLDWSQTSLGPVESWPQSLRTSVSICLNSRFPMILWWGPELTVLYNDPYIPILGKKHPKRALGLPGAEVWAEVWPVIEPMLMQVLKQGEANWADDLQLFINRTGYAEECYFRFSYSPISDESGGIGGVFTPVSETTNKVVAERRLLTLRELAECGTQAQSTVQTCQSLIQVLGKNSFDLPFSALYFISPDQAEARLVTCVGVAAGESVSPHSIALSSSDPSQFSAAARAIIGEGEASQVLENLSDFPSLPPGPWGDPPSSIVLLPVRKPGQTEVVALLVAGVSARKHLDADYRSFFELVAQQTGTAISAARAYEEERKRAEALAALDRAKTAFFSNVSHEFRTPLTLMLGPLEETLAQREQLPAAVVENVTIAHRNCLRLQKMVAALLDFSRIESGRIRASFQPTELASFTADLAASFRSLMQSGGLGFEVECQSLSQQVWVDREMWEKIVLNLLSNAFKFTMTGSVKVCLEERAGRVLLAVQDTGIGIPEHELPHVFERFHRVEGSSGRTLEGSGIGLALVSELVHLHGGSVAVESKPGEGSIFVVCVPLGNAHLPADRLTPSQDWRTPPTAANSFIQEAGRWMPESEVIDDQQPNQSEIEGLILLADDNADMRDYVRKLLSRRFEVITAAHGREAISLIERYKPDLILSDVMMPELDGMGLLREVRANPETRRLPFILLSARAGEESATEGLDAGADDYLVKPFTAGELLARVGAHLRLARSRTSYELRETQWRTEAETARDQAVAVLESITDGFFTLDHNWCFTYVNPAAEQLMGATQAELLGKNHWEVFPGAVGSTVEREYRRAHRDLAQVEFENYYEPWKRWFSVKANATKLGGIAVYFRDITQRKQTENALREGELRFRELADNISQFAWMADETGALYWYNQRWYDYTGTTLEQMRGWGWQSVHHPEHVDRVTETFKTALAAGTGWEDTFPLRSKTGEWRWFLSRARPIHDENGRIIRWFGTNTDITEQLESERKLRAANRDLEQFAFSASHDLQEPLRNVSIYSQLIQKHSAAWLDEQSLQFLDYILEGSKRMASLISDLLVYTQAATADQDPVEPANAEQVLNDIRQGFSRVIQEKGARIANDPLPLVAVKAIHLQQIFQNLVGNSLKYQKDDELPQIHIGVLKKENQLQFCVRDNGIGIAPQFHDRVFGIFKRLHPKGGKYPGTGIGLAICQRIVERYGGRIWLDSELGKGTAFYFTLPAVEGDSDAK